MAPTLVLCFYLEGGALAATCYGLATDLEFFLFFSSSTMHVTSASSESLAEFISLSDNILRSCSFTSRCSKSCSYVC